MMAHACKPCTGKDPAWWHTPANPALGRNQHGGTHLRTLYQEGRAQRIPGAGWPALFRLIGGLWVNKSYLKEGGQLLMITSEVAL